MVRPYVVDGARAEEDSDPRVSAVLEVLGGRGVTEVAVEYRVEPALLHRWVRAYTDAGTAAVTNRPEAEAGQQRDRFLAAFAHEVRTPLTVALGWLTLLVHDGIAPELTRATLAKLHKALNQLSERTHDVELMATASMGRLATWPELVAVRELVAELDPAPELTGATDLELLVDPWQFRRVLRDLWDAAATRPAPRRRWVDVRRDGPWVELRVVREGDPIETPLLQALFDPFDLNDDSTGVTIGLYLVRALTVLHGGSVGVEQDDERAAFWVRIPDRRPTQEDA